MAVLCNIVSCQVEQYIIALYNSVLVVLWGKLEGVQYILFYSGCRFRHLNEC